MSVVLAVAVAMLSGSLPARPSQAEDVAPFAELYSATASGPTATAGNALAACDPSDADCPPPSTPLDADGNPATTAPPGDASPDGALPDGASPDGAASTSDPSPGAGAEDPGAVTPTYPAFSPPERTMTAAPIAPAQLELAEADDDADLAVTIKATPNNPQPRRAVHYTITVTNHGPAVATGITLQADMTSTNPGLPGFDEVFPGDSGFDCSNPANTPIRVYCSLPTLAAGQTATILMISVIPGVYGAFITTTNTVRLTSATPDPTMANNTAAATATTRAMSTSLVPFSPRFSANTNGTITTIGNQLLTCPPAATGCTEGLQGIGNYILNNDFAMTNLNADTSSHGFANSSGAELVLPAGAEVLWAGLYWGSRLSYAQSETNTHQTMRLKVPGSTTYQAIRSNVAFGPTAANYSYQELADVTHLVRAAGSGYYWGAGVLADSGSDRYAGWALTVVYRHNSLEPRNLTVFDGFAYVVGGANEQIPISGFLTPSTGTVNTQLGMVAWEGDLGLVGDYARLNNVTLSTAVSPADNFFNATNDNNGVIVQNRTPAHRNMLGFDIKNLSAPGAIANGATSATFTFGSSGDVYFPGVFTTAISLYAPTFVTSTKTVRNLDGNLPASPGDRVRYTVTFTNSGDDGAVDAISSDVLPANVTYVPGSLTLLGSPNRPLTDAPGDDVGEYVGDTVTVRLGDGANATSGGYIGVGKTFAYEFDATVDAAAAGTTVSNTATIDYVQETLREPGSHTLDPATFPVIQELADLAITKSMSPSPATAGNTVTSTLTVVNNGPTSAANVVVNDTLPAGLVALTATSSAGADCSINAGSPYTVDCPLGTLGSSATATVTITARIPADFSPTSITNRATVTSTTPDPVSTNNQAEAAIPVAPSADLAVTKTASDSTPSPGTSTSFTITVTNNGPSVARSFALTDSVLTSSRSGLLLTGVSAGPGLACTPPPASTFSEFDCTGGELAVGASATLTVSAWLAPNVAEGTTLENSVEVSSTTPDPNMANNRATRSIQAGTPWADVAVSKTGSASAVAGGPISYTLGAQNLGPADATSVVITDVVPASIIVSSATTSSGSCAVDPPAASKAAGQSQTVTCTFGRLAGPGMLLPDSGGKVEATISGTLGSDAPAGGLVNTARVTSDHDPNPANDEDSATTAVGASADLAVTKTVANPSASAGTSTTFTITVTNNGPSVARNLTLSDGMVNGGNSGITFEDVTPGPGLTCPGFVPPTQDWSFECTAAQLAVGASVTVSVRAWVGTAVLAGARLENKVEVSSQTPDPDTSNNTASAVILAGTPWADVSVAKTAPATAIAGGSISYTLNARNLGPAEATSVVISDEVPAAITVSSAVSNSGSCSVNPPAATKTPSQSQTVTCPIGRLTAPERPFPSLGGSAQVTITGTVDPGTPAGGLVNTALVASDHDPNPDNDEDSATTVIGAAADLVVTKTADASAPSAGTSFTYTVTVRNNGPSVARDLVLNDAIPTANQGALHLISVAPGTGLTCPAGDVTQTSARCTASSLAVGA
ncbi:MAG: hypothetical protein FWD59_06940, partial [Micrococcales bacterium]|nr:hypothetical protein [Micrococcales bacterium]